MNSRQLRYFEEVLRQGSFSAASRSLNVAQPALSGHVADLEAELGVKLFERTNRGVVPTSAGNRLGEHAATILRQMAVAQADVSSGGTDPSGEVLVALPLTSAQLLAGPLTRRVEAELPKVRLQILEGLSYQSTDVLTSGRADLGVVPHAAEIENLEVAPLFYESLHLVGRWDGTSPRVGEIPLRALADYPLVMGGLRVNLRRLVEEAALQHGVPLQKRYESPGMHALFSYLGEGLCWTVANWPLIQPYWEHAQLCARKIVEPEIRRTMTLVWPKNRPMTDAVLSVRRILVLLLRDSVARGDWPADPIGLMDDALL